MARVLPELGLRDDLLPGHVLLARPGRGRLSGGAYIGRTVVREFNGACVPAAGHEARLGGMDGHSLWH